jgi:alpha-L-fucosidase
MQWWTDATFGMFIHWGIYAVPAHAEWYMTKGHVPRKKYEKYASQFDPHHFNADYWARVAKNAGMKYLVITSKHHDGFSMFNTSATNYNVIDDTPWHTDPMKALSKACKKYGIKFGFYYSIMDWHSKYQLPHDNSDPEHPTYNPTKIKPVKKDDYIKYMKTQLRELIKQYDPAILWFDGEWVNWWTKEDGKKLYNYLRKLKPDLIINNRIGKGHNVKGMVGDYGTPEQKIPPNGIPGSYWETCMTINDHWGYYKGDHDFKSDTTLIRNLIDIASKGGNYLLNVGPTAQGIIPLPEVTRLSAMGRWLNIYGKAIYATKASPFKKKFKWGRVTQGDHKLYLEIFQWPEDGKLTLPAYKGKISSAHLMGDPNRSGVTAHQNGNHITINLPGEAPDGIASVVEIGFADGNI